MNIFKNALCLILCVAVIPLPSFAATQNASRIISTIQVVETVERESLKQEIFELIQQNDLTDELAKSGVGKAEIEERMAGLTQTELLALHTDIQEAKAGGILVAILLVVLIIYFAQRI